MLSYAGFNDSATCFSRETGKLVRLYRVCETNVPILLSESIIWIDRFVRLDHELSK